MDSNSFDTSSVIDSIRRADVGRRGGVRVRGGRLPPIRIRDTALQLVTTKKVIAPKIPPRRIKREEPSRSTTYGAKVDNRRSCETANSRQRSSQGRERGTKVYLQSEGTFLGEGPAFKLKKEAQTSSYERGSRGSRIKTEDTKFDPDGLKYMLGDYDEDESYFEGENLLLPVRFPIIKKEIKQEIKKETKEEIKTDIKNEIKKEIKEEMLEIDGIKQIIKKEPLDSLEEECNLEENKVIDELKKVKILQTEPSDSLDNIKFLKDEEVLFYLQMPSCLPFKQTNQPTSADIPSKVSEKTNQESKMETPEVTLKELREGHIGKLQILRSGKMRLILGSVKMAVESAEVSTFCDAVCILNENEDEGDAAIIGNIDQKMVVRPLLNDVQDEKVFLEDTC